MNEGAKLGGGRFRIDVREKLADLIGRLLGLRRSGIRIAHQFEGRHGFRLLPCLVKNRGLIECGVHSLDWSFQALPWPEDRPGRVSRLGVINFN